ncbi:hypothetical protein PoB_001535800 [Plakobranchus ocellatus]|uniref:Uncharacterized protein n=1 Tax=Plakobranchus ocellatus TaxID=259542 RepID=A0AAV3Z2X5_9GAST|nr:hypothetical protein PoB_001535800 [Plakobranchus ocellatus]
MDNLLLKGGWSKYQTERCRGDLQEWTGLRMAESQGALEDRGTRGNGEGTCLLLAFRMMGYKIKGRSWSRSGQMIERACGDKVERRCKGRTYSEDFTGVDGSVDSQSTVSSAGASLYAGSSPTTGALACRKA